MKIRFPGRLSSIALAVALAVAAPAASAAQRAFVASTGLDTNDCSLIHPCRTFGAAIAATFAGGEVVVLDSAGYGPFTIDKAVSVISPPGIYAGISVASGDGITITAGATDVVRLRGLRINGTGGTNGIVAYSVGLLDVANVEVSGLTNRCFYFDAPAAQLTVADSLFQNCNQGLHVANTGTRSFVTIVNSRFDRNTNTGANIAGNAYATITGSSASFNGLAGFMVREGASAGIADCAIAGNDVYGMAYGVYVLAGSAASVARCTMSGGTYGAVAWGAGAKLAVVDTTVTIPTSPGAGIAAAAGGEVTAERCTVIGGAHGMSAGLAGNSTLRASNSTLVDNTTDAFYIYAAGSTIETRGNNTVQGNGAIVTGGSLTPIVPQ